MFFIRGEGGGLSSGQAGGKAEVVCPRLRWLCVQGACVEPCFCSQHPVFTPDFPKVADGILVSLYLLQPKFALTEEHMVIFSPI